MRTDEGLDITRSFGVRQKGKEVALPATYVLDPNRKILFAEVGISPKGRPESEKILKVLP